MMDTLTRYCDLWWSWALAASWQLALLVVLIALVAGLSRRLSARFRYTLWTLVLIKVFLPPSLGLPWSIGGWAGDILPEPPVTSVAREASSRALPADPVRGPGALETGRGPAAEKAPLPRERPEAELAAMHAEGDAEVDPGVVPRAGFGPPSEFESVESAAARAGPAMASLIGASARSDLLGWSRRVLGPSLMAAWALGALGMLSIIGLRYARLTRGFRSAQEVDEGPLRVLLERLAQKLGCKTAPDLILSERVTSPFLCGVFRPRIVLPASLPGALKGEELESVLLHELVHWKRGDVAIGWAQVVSQALFWFHPMVWFANSRLRHERESACDEAALALGQPAPEKYGESLLKVLLAARGRSAAAVGYLGIFERNTRLQRRLEDIMNLEKKNRKLGAWGWTFIALFAVAFLPMAGAEDPGSGQACVHFVLGDREMTFEGEKTTLEEIRSRLEKVPDRAGTVLCFAVDTLSLTLEKVEPVKGKLMLWTRELGFKHFSDIGVHPLGSYGTAPSPYNDRLVKQVTVDIDKSPEGTRLSVQYAVLAICKAAGIPYQWDKSAKLADPMRRRYIDPLHVKDVLVEKALLDVLNPAGLRFDLDKDGLYLRYPGGFQEESSAPKAVVEAGAPSLQREIDAASPGATVKVPAGKHAGPLVITKPLSLKGEGLESSAIELLGNGPAILVRGVKGVSIEDLTVRWSPKSTDAQMEYPAAVAVRDADVTIRRCGLEPMDTVQPDLTPYGLLATGRSGVTFAEGRSTGFAYALMFIEGAAGTVSDSFLQKAGHSVVTLHPGSVVKIERNILARCEYHAVRNTGGTMEMTSNLVADNHRAGAYLGNKSAHGTIINNLFTGSNGEIWGYSGSDVELRNNVFWKSRQAAIGFRDTCRLKLTRNSFAGNPVGITLYSQSKDSKQAGATAEGNHYWQNGKDTENFEKEASSISGDPRFVDPAKGDFRAEAGSPLKGEGKAVVGLEDPQPIRKLWELYRSLSQAALPAPARSQVERPQGKDAASSDRERLQGSWVGRVSGGREVQCTISVSGDKVEVRAGDGKEWYKGKFALVETADPRQIDVVITECAADRYIGKTGKGIYKLEGNQMTLAAYEPGRDARPTSLESTGGARLFVLSRVSAEGASAPKVASLQEWPQYAGGPEHNNCRKRDDGIQCPKVLWHLDQTFGQPTLGGGRLYSGGKGLFAIDPATGKVLASFGVEEAKSNVSFGAAPTLGEGMVIARQSSVGVLALDPDLSKVKWKCESKSEGFDFPGTLAEGLYIFASDREVVALRESDGTAAWRTQLDDKDDISMVPAVAAGKVFFGSSSGKFLAMDLKTGQKAWTYEGQAQFGWTSPVAAFGKVFVGDRGIHHGRRGAVNAFDQGSGKLVWSTVFGATGLSTPGVGEDFIVAGFGRTVGKFDATTGEISPTPRIRTGTNAFGSPTVVGETLYFGNLDGHLYAHDMESGDRKWAFEVPDAQVLDFVHTGDRIFASTSKGLFALENDPGKGPAPGGFVLQWKEKQGG